MSVRQHFFIVGSNSVPIYEADLNMSTKPSTLSFKRDDEQHNLQLIAYSALDLIDEAVWVSNSLYLKSVDKFNEWVAYAYTTPGNTRFILLRDNNSDVGIHEFFTGCHEFYLKTLLNPFYKDNTTINSPAFDGKVRQLARRHLLYI